MEKLQGAVGGMRENVCNLDTGYVGGLSDEFQITRRKPLWDLYT